MKQRQRRSYLVYDSEAIIREADRGMRVDEKAPQQLAEKLRNQAELILDRAHLLARRSGRKKIKQIDIEIAAQLI